MSDDTTIVMLDAYKQDATPTSFLSGQFRSPRKNFHNQEKIEIDIVRSEEDIAIAIQDLSTGARLNAAQVYTNKEFEPPIFKEAGPVNAHKLIKRQPGQNPFAAVDFMVNAISQGIDLGKKMQRKIQRATEFQASQVLTLGVVTLIDSAGTAIYTVDYQPKATHFPTAGTAWSAASPTMLADVQALANVIRADGLHNPDMLIMGETSYELFIQDADVDSRLDNRRLDGNGIVPMNRLGNGGIFRGIVEIGNYRYDIYTHDGRYKHPQTGVSTKFVPDDKVIVRASSGRLDATFGGIPRLVGIDPRIPSQLTQRVSVPGQMMDIQMNAWITPDGETLMVQAGTRPMLIPTAIDTFGCLDTNL